ncbi:50S ribosomal protein L13 [Patescibacteria group bacterium]|nr:50S ribosomal protein L13 [Patescibacteria group bacterium]MBU1890877.1 50S ribosomal protein L13 [Patescibacteria group bacterium]
MTKNKPEIHKIDAKDQVVGRLATRISHLLQGKHRVDYASNKDFDIRVEIENIKEFKVSPNKADQKLYYRYTGYPGGLKTMKMNDYLKNDRHRVVLYKAVYNMLPKNKMRSVRMRRLIFK